MPLGNGDVGLNVWVEPNGYWPSSRNARRTHSMRLIRRQSWRIRFQNGSPLAGRTLRQTLSPIDVEDRGWHARLRVWVDANQPWCVWRNSQTPRAGIWRWSRCAARSAVFSASAGDRRVSGSTSRENVWHYTRNMSSRWLRNSELEYAGVCRAELIDPSALHVRVPAPCGCHGEGPAILKSRKAATRFNCSVS